jgi:hypothetical protein
MAQSVPDNGAVPDVIDAPRPQVLSAITGQLPVERTMALGNATLLQLDLSAFSGDIAGAIARALSTGPGNTAVIGQQGNSNTARIDQTGQSNVALMVQRGNYNTSTLLQDGSSNVYGSLLNGANNTLDVEQVGHNNTYLFGFQGSNLNHSFEQIGNGNTAVQIGVNYEPFGIQQRGNNMNMTIRHNGVQ